MQLPSGPRQLLYLLHASQSSEKMKGQREPTHFLYIIYSLVQSHWLEQINDHIEAQGRVRNVVYSWAAMCPAKTLELVYYRKGRMDVGE